MATDTLTLDPANVTAAAPPPADNSTAMTLDDLQVNAPAPTPNRGPPPNPDREELVIYTGGRRLYGWMYCRIVAEIFPRHFEIECTERFPNPISQAIVQVLE